MKPGAHSWSIPASRIASGVLILGALANAAGAASWSAKKEEVLRTPRSPTTAVLTSVSATLLPMVGGLAIAAAEEDAWPYGGVLFGSGLILGPSGGYVYAQEGSRGATGIAIRFGIAAGATVITALVSANQPHGGFLDFSGVETTLGVAAGGCALVLIDGIYDMARLPGVVGDHNRSLRNHGELRAVPFVRDGGRTVGASLTLSFD
ncbi:MAG: hypothetical protein ACE15D_11930 [Candidatus Eisenbacteria bacterium]